MKAPSWADDLTFAFQPIVDTAAGELFAYEALLRGANGEQAEAVFASIGNDDVLAFDAACRMLALRKAALLGIESRLSINVSAAAICDDKHGLFRTLSGVWQLGWPVDRLIFEMTEQAPIKDPDQLADCVAAARDHGVTVAIDDFGAGYATINSLLLLRPRMIKLDMLLVRDINMDISRQALVRGVVEACGTFDCTVVAEGVETRGEFETLRSLGITLMQGYLFARPIPANLLAPSLPADLSFPAWARRAPLLSC